MLISCRGCPSNGLPVCQRACHNAVRKSETKFTEWRWERTPMLNSMSEKKLTQSYPINTIWYLVGNTDRCSLWANRRTLSDQISTAARSSAPALFSTLLAAGAIYVFGIWSFTYIDRKNVLVDLYSYCC